jgi:hypothetical protein
MKLVMTDMVRLVNSYIVVFSWIDLVNLKDIDQGFGDSIGIVFCVSNRKFEISHQSRITK